MTHREISFIKSWVRIAGYIALMVAGWKLGDHWRHFLYAGVILIVAEYLGIKEEKNER